MRHKIAILTAGGLAPCLSSSIGRLIKKYTELIPDAEIIGYLNGYKGLLTGNSIKVSDKVRRNCEILYEYGGSVFGNSRVKLSNRENENEPSIFKVDSVSLTENGLVINLVISRDELVKLLSSNGS